MDKDREARHRKLGDRALLVGTILLLSHLVTFQPSELSALGIKITIGDPAMIRGVIALIYLHYAVAVLSQPNRSDARLERERRLTLVRYFAELTPKRLKGTPRGRAVVIMIGTLRLLMFNAHVAILTTLMTIAFGFAVVDAFKFGRLVVNVILASF